MNPHPVTSLSATRVPSGSRAAGDLLREWRLRRRLSQLDLALAVGVSTRHLSYVETGRSVASREMMLRLVAALDVPLRGRNALLLAAGYAPMFRERPLDDPALGLARSAVETILRGHEPHPALAIDRHWNLLAANRAVAPLLAGVAAALLRPPVNVLRLSLHPDGLASRIVGFARWRAHLLHRVGQQVDASGDASLDALLAESRGYPVPDDGSQDVALPATLDGLGIAVPFRLRTDHGELAFFGTTTVFGTPVDVTLAELALECFFPADAATAATMRRLLDAATRVEVDADADAAVARR